MIPVTKRHNENHDIHQPHENHGKSLHVLEEDPGNSKFSEALSDKGLAEGLETPADG